MVMVGETLAQAPLQMLTLGADIGEQVVALDRLLHRQRCGAGQRVGQVRVPMLEQAGAVAEGGEDRVRQQHGPNRLVTSAEALGDGQ
jgi:hypothetical protein